MAWPNTPLTTYLSGGLPALKAFDNNSYQSAINGIINGTYSLHSVTVDGTGGVVVAGTGGTMLLGASASGVVAPLASVPWGRLYKESAIFGFAVVDSAGTLQSGFNVKAEPGPLLGATHLTAGNYAITFHGAPTNVARVQTLAIPFNNGGARLIEALPAGLSGADLLVNVRTFSTAAGFPAADAGFAVVAWGG